MAPKAQWPPGMRLSASDSDSKALARSWALRRIEGRVVLRSILARWHLQVELYWREIQIAADGSIVRMGDAVFVLQPPSLWGHVEAIHPTLHGFGGMYGNHLRSTRRVYGNMKYRGRWFFVSSVINAKRGPVVLAVRALQRAHREWLRISPSYQAYQAYKRKEWKKVQQDIFTIAKCIRAGEGNFVRRSKIE